MKKEINLLLMMSLFLAAGESIGMKKNAQNSHSSDYNMQSSSSNSTIGNFDNVDSTTSTTSNISKGDVDFVNEKSYIDLENKIYQGLPPFSEFNLEQLTDTNARSFAGECNSRLEIAAHNRFIQLAQSDTEKIIDYFLDKDREADCTTKVQVGVTTYQCFLVLPGDMRERAIFPTGLIGKCGDVSYGIFISECSWLGMNERYAYIFTAIPIDDKGIGVVKHFFKSKIKKGQLSIQIGQNWLNDKKLQFSHFKKEKALAKVEDKKLKNGVETTRNIEEQQKDFVVNSSKKIAHTLVGNEGDGVEAAHALKDNAKEIYGEVKNYFNKSKELKKEGNIKNQELSELEERMEQNKRDSQQLWQAYNAAGNKVMENFYFATKTRFANFEIFPKIEYSEEDMGVTVKSEKSNSSDEKFRNIFAYPSLDKILKSSGDTADEGDQVFRVIKAVNINGQSWLSEDDLIISSRSNFGKITGEDNDLICFNGIPNGFKLESIVPLAFLDTQKTGNFAIYAVFGKDNYDNDRAFLYNRGVELNLLDKFTEETKKVFKTIGDKAVTFGTKIANFPEKGSIFIQKSRLELQKKRLEKDLAYIGSDLKDASKLRQAGKIVKNIFKNFSFSPKANLVNQGISNIRDKINFDKTDEKDQLRRDKEKIEKEICEINAKLSQLNNKREIIQYNQEHQGVVRGLANNGDNICYANAVLQLLANNMQFVMALENDQTNNMTVSTMQSFLQEYHDRNNYSILTRPFVYGFITQLGMNFKPGDQQDAQDFMSKLLTGLFSEVPSVFDITSTTTYSNGNRPIESVVQSLPVQLEQDGSLLQELVTHSMHAAEDVSETNYTNFSDTVLLYVGRQWGMNNRILIQPIVDINGEAYEVTGIVNRTGSCQENGHYFAYVRRNNKWYHCNDLEITY